MPPKRMSYKFRLHAVSKKSPCTSSKRSRPKPNHISFLPDSPDSLDSTDLPQNISDLCSDSLSNLPDSLTEQEQLYSDFNRLCEVTLDSPRSLTFSQELDGKSDEDFLKEFNFSSCSVVLCRCDSFPERPAKKSDEDLLAEYDIYHSCVRLERLKKSELDHWVQSLPHKHLKTHYSGNYVSELDTMGCDYFLQCEREEEVNYEELCRKRGYTFRSLKFEQFKDAAQKSVMVCKNRLDLRLRCRLELRRRICELIRKRENELKQKKRIYFEKDSYVLLNAEDVSKVRTCQIDLGLDCSSSSECRTCDLASKEESLRREGHKICYENNFFVFVPKEADIVICREAVEKEKQCKVVANLRCCSLSPDSMRRLFESINEGEKETLNNRRTNCEQDSENNSPSLDSVSRISDSNSSKKSLYRRSSNSPVSMSSISGSINSDISPHGRTISISSDFMARARELMTRKKTMHKRKVFYPDDHYVMVNHGDVSNNRTAVEVVLNKPRQKRIKAIHNSEARLIQEAMRNEKNCRVVLEDLNLSLHAMPHKIVIKKGQKKRKEVGILENAEYVPLSLNNNSISRLRESTCEKEADLGQKRRKSSGNECFVFVNRQCYSKLRMAVQNMEHCNIALDSNIGHFRLKETVSPPYSVPVHPRTHRDISSFAKAQENCPGLVASQSSDPDWNNSQNFVLDQDSLSSSSCNLSSDFKTTFSGSSTSDLSDSLLDAIEIDQNSLPLTLNSPLLSPTHSTCPQSTNESVLSDGHRTNPQYESMSQESHRIYPESTNESLSSEDQGTFPSFTSEFSSSSQTCVTQELLVNQTSEKSIVAQYSSSQETCTLSQNIRGLTSTGVQCSPLLTNDNCSQELFGESQNSPTQHSIPRSPNPLMSTPDSALSASENYSQEPFVDVDSPTPCSNSGSPEPCDSTLSSVESSESDHLTTAHVTKQDSPNTCSTSASPIPYLLTQNSPALTVSGASCVTKPESPIECNSSASLNPNSLTLTTSELTPAHVTILDSPDSCSTSASPNPYSLTQNRPALTVSGALTSCVTRPESPNACHPPASLNPNSLTLTTSVELTPAHVTILDSSDSCSTSASPNPYSLTQNSPALTVSGALTSCVTKPESPNACHPPASPNPKSLTLTTSGELTLARITTQDSPDAHSASISSKPHSPTHNGLTLTASSALIHADSEFADSPTASSPSTSMDTDSEDDDEQADSNVDIFKMDIAHEALDFSALNGNRDAQEIPHVPEHENMPKVRTNGVVKGLDSSPEEMDYSSEEEENYCPLQFGGKAGVKIMTNGLCNGRNSDIDSDHSSSSTIITNERRDDLGKLYRYMPSFTNNDR